MSKSLLIDVRRCIVEVGGKKVSLAPKELALLSALVESGGVAVSREKLLAKCWGIDGSIELDKRTVDQHICRLRKKIGSHAQSIRTVSGVGFAFDGPVDKPNDLLLPKSLESQIRVTLDRLNGLLLRASKHR